MPSLRTTVLLCLVIIAPALLSAADTRDLPHAFAAGWQGEKTCDLLFADATVRVGRCEFPPGVGHEKHYHRPHFGYVLEGSTMRISDSVGTREVSNRAGDSWSTDAVTVHEAVNVGKTTARYLIVEPIRP